MNPETTSSPGPSISKILLPIVILVLVVVGYGTMAKNYNWWPHTISSMSPSPSPSTSDISDWQTYRNAELGFELRYPDSWSVTTSGLSNYVAWKDASGNSVMIVEYRSDDRTDVWYDQVPRNSITLDERIGNQFVYAYCDGPPPDNCTPTTVAYVVPHLAGVLGVQFRGDEKLDTTELQILATFHFTK